MEEEREGEAEGWEAVGWDRAEEGEGAREGAAEGVKAEGASGA